MNANATGRPRRPKGTNAAVCVAVATVMAQAVSAVAQDGSYQSASGQAVGSGPGQQPLQKGSVFEPRVDTAVQYVNNINLAPKGANQVDVWGIEAAPGFYGSYSSGSLIGAIDYSIIGRAWNDSDYNEIQQIGSANGRWNAAPSLFYVDAQGSISDVPINPAESLDFGGIGIFGQNNMTQQATAGISPTLDRQFGNFNLLARYSYGRVWYFDQGNAENQVGFIGQDNSQDQSVNASFGNSASGQKLTGQAFYNWQYTDYENALPYRYEQAGFSGAWLVTPSTAFVGEFGAESDLTESTTQGGLDSNFWSAGLRWEPDERTYVEARYGERFFGHTYYFAASRTARMFEFNVSYSEEPNVQTQILSIGDFTPGELPSGGDSSVNFGRLNSDPYVGKSATAGVTAVGTRTTLRLLFFQNVQDYVQQVGDDDIYAGVTFDASRKLASNLSADFGVSYTEYQQGELQDDQLDTPLTNTYYTQLGGSLNRESSGGKLTTSLEAGYAHSAGTAEYNRYDGWWVGLRARWKP